ncbi:uncharacterized protein SCHCODRAFT_02564148 [Schizophyllum commune H4-8]|nr:uncharacterized protein SCHCODRAFT_02564148 [Schizophyllum commune H4-8]KAI5898964.1 hypothetical protein SCHCODRAFT_02564148 [Schizophyllum commune H4-8]
MVLSMLPSVYYSHTYGRASPSAGLMDPQDLAVTVTEDRHRSAIARLLGRNRTPSLRFFTARVNSQNLAAIARAMNSHRAMSPSHLDEAQASDDPSDFPGHNPVGERSQRATSEASGEAQASPVVTIVPYPPADSVSRSDTAPYTAPYTQAGINDAPTIASESDTESHSFPSGSGESSTPTLTASSPLSTISIIRHSRLTQPLQSPATQAARLRGYLEDPGPSTARSRPHAAGGGHRLSNATADPTDTPVGQQRLDSISEVNASSQEAASQPPSPAEPASSAHDSESSDADPAAAQAANQHGHEDDLTYLSFEVQKVNKGPFVDHRLSIRVGKRYQLGDLRSAPFTQRLDEVFEVCEASQFAFTELFLDVLESTVRGGGLNGRDAFIQILLRLVPHLRNLHHASVKFYHDESAYALGDASAQELQSVLLAFPRLRHLQLEGNTTLTRLRTFPLRQLRKLEVLTEVSESIVEGLALSCRKLDTLIAGPVVPDTTGQDFPETSANTPAHGQAGFPSFLRIFSAHPCEKLLATASRGSVEVDFTLTNAQYLPDVRESLGKNPASVIRIV